MVDPFDPYHKWLGIAPKDQPPHHYRLLGIDPFEEDREVIDAAANRVMSYLKELAIGDVAAHSQQIMNEVTQARMCLLKPKRKEEYDAKLRAMLSTEQLLPPLTAPPRSAAADATTSSPPLGTAVVTYAPKPRYSCRPTSLMVAVAGSVIVLASVILGVILITLNRWQLDEVTLANGQSDTQDSAVRESTGDPDIAQLVPREPKLSVQPFRRAGSGDRPAPNLSPDSPGEDGGGWNTPPRSAAAKDLTEREGTVDGSSVNDGSSAVPAVTDPTDAREISKPVVLPSPEPLPSVEDQERAMVLVQEMFGKAIADATTVENCTLTARRMLQAAGDASENASTRSALLVEAHKLAITAGDMTLVNETMDCLVRDFTIDGLKAGASLLDTKASILEELGRRAKTPDDLAVVAESAFTLADQAAADGQTDVAKRMASAALSMARKAGKSELVRKATLRLVELQ